MNNEDYANYSKILYPERRGGEIGGGGRGWCIEPVVSWNNRRDSRQMVSLKYSIHRKMLFAPGQSESNLVYSVPPSLPPSSSSTCRCAFAHVHTCTLACEQRSPPLPSPSQWVCQNETTCVVWMHAILTRLTLHYSAN